MQRSDSLANIRRAYTKGSLSETDLYDDPFNQFTAWFEDYKGLDPLEPNSMVLATSNAEGQPSARVVLLKELNDEGFVFFTNYGSRKGKDIDENQKACLLFYWDFLERQIRIEGPIEKINQVESAAYFQSRPRGSQIGAWASPQSKVIPGRAHLDQLFRQAEDQFKTNEEIDCPDHWGGYIVKPLYFEFWQGRDNRLHDRISFRRGTDAGNWELARLAP